ncbi:MAG: hypothetical protein ABIG44_03655 [Planctomycetota bacterium]
MILDLPPKAGFERTGRKPHQVGKRCRKQTQGQKSLFDGTTPDAMERRPLEFHRRVRTLFRKLPEVYPAPAVLINANREADAVFADVLEAIEHAFQ